MSMIELGGNIELSGFKEIDPQSLIVVKKIVGNYAKRFNDMSPVDKLTLTSKPVHERESSSLYEIQVKLVSKGKIANSAMTDRNIFVAIDSALKKVEQEVNK
jgi:ribosome-associated translation inhibitor RaiA